MTKHAVIIGSESGPRGSVHDMKMLGDEKMSSTAVLQNLSEKIIKSKPGDSIQFVFFGNGGTEKDGSDSHIYVGFEDDGTHCILFEEDFRKIAEIIPEGVSFTMLINANKSGRILQGASKQAAHARNKIVVEKALAHLKLSLQDKEDRRMNQRV